MRTRPRYTGDETGAERVISVTEYRKILGDQKTSDTRILERIDFLTAFAREIARTEIQKYVAAKKNKN